MMQNNYNQTNPISLDPDSSMVSWQVASTPQVLTDVFQSHRHVTVWQRSSSEPIVNYFDTVFTELGVGLRSVYSLASLKQALERVLPEAEGKVQAIEDIYLLSDMLTCLFDCTSVGLRLVPLTSAMCPRFHVDNIPVRLVCTYLGHGTQWLPTEAVNHTKLGHGSKGSPDGKSGLYHDQSAVQQLEPFDVALLKGSAWENDVTKAVVHRSCPVETGCKRVLLTLDPM